MANVDKIKGLAKEKGISITHLCTAVGQGPYYLNDVKKEKCKMPMERLTVIADILGTTVEYLTDQTDDPSKKEKPSFISDETWNMIQNDPFAVELLEGYSQLNNEKRAELKVIWKRIIDEQNKK